MAARDASAATSLLQSARARWPDGYVALCVVAKDQHRDLRYWIAYHRWLGVDKFYVMDHNSSRPMLPVVMDLVRQGVVEYQYFVGGLTGAPGRWRADARGYTKSAWGRGGATPAKAGSMQR
jgi:hypothetical protein